MTWTKLKTLQGNVIFSADRFANKKMRKNVENWHLLHQLLLFYSCFHLFVVKNRFKMSFVPTKEFWYILHRSSSTASSSSKWIFSNWICRSDFNALMHVKLKSTLIWHFKRFSKWRPDYDLSWRCTNLI